jgi:hypothetical protein
MAEWQNCRMAELIQGLVEWERAVRLDCEKININSTLS